MGDEKTIEKWYKTINKTKKSCENGGNNINRYLSAVKFTVPNLFIKSQWKKQKNIPQWLQQGFNQWTNDAIFAEEVIVENILKILSVSLYELKTSEDETKKENAKKMIKRVLDFNKLFDFQEDHVDVSDVTSQAMYRYVQGLTDVPGLTLSQQTEKLNFDKLIKTVHVSSQHVTPATEPGPDSDEDSESESDTSTPDAPTSQFLTKVTTWFQSLSTFKTVAFEEGENNVKFLLSYIKSERPHELPDVESTQEGVTIYNSLVNYKGRIDNENTVTVFPNEKSTLQTDVSSNTTEVICALLYDFFVVQKKGRQFSEENQAWVADVLIDLADNKQNKAISYDQSQVSKINFIQDMLSDEENQKLLREKGLNEETLQILQPGVTPVRADVPVKPGVKPSDKESPTDAKNQLDQATDTPKQTLSEKVRSHHEEAKKALDTVLKALKKTKDAQTTTEAQTAANEAQAAANEATEAVKKATEAVKKATKATVTTEIKNLVEQAQESANVANTAVESANHFKNKKVREQMVLKDLASLSQMKNDYSSDINGQYDSFESMQHFENVFSYPQNSLKKLQKKNKDLISSLVKQFKDKTDQQSIIQHLWLKLLQVSDNGNNTLQEIKLNDNQRKTRGNTDKIQTFQENVALLMLHYYTFVKDKQTKGIWSENKRFVETVFKKTCTIEMNDIGTLEICQLPRDLKGWFYIRKSSDNDLPNGFGLIDDTFPDDIDQKKQGISLTPIEIEIIKSFVDAKLISKWKLTKQPLQSSSGVAGKPPRRQAPRYRNLLKHFGRRKQTKGSSASTRRPTSYPLTFRTRRLIQRR